MADQFYKILVTTADGRSVLWHKQGQVHLLPAELADTWVQKFKPQFFDILPSGEMVGSGRDPQALKIVKVEKIRHEG